MTTLTRHPLSAGEEVKEEEEEAVQDEDASGGDSLFSHSSSFPGYL